MRSFRITYNDIANNITRKTIIGVSKESGDLGQDAHAAVKIFISCIGNLKKFDILEIQELDKGKNPIGDPITPMENSTMVPIKK